MNELFRIKRHISDLFDKGDSAELTRIYVVLTDIMAHLTVLRGILAASEMERLEKETKKGMSDEGKM